MKLILNCRTHEGKPAQWVYDNETNELWDENGGLVDLTKDDRLTAYARTRSPKGRGKYASNKSKDISILRIQLGLKCNMHCKYCAQEHDKDREGWVSSPKDVPGFIEKLKASGINVRHNVQLWGGEPFVYWKTLQRLIPELRAMYPAVGISMITNGTLITEEKIEFLKKYDCSITISHDAQGYKLRGEDPLDDPKMVDLWRLAVKELHAGINCVLTPANTDVEAIAAYFEEKLGDAPVGFEGIMTHCGVQADELMFTEEKLLDLQKSLFKMATQHGWGSFPAASRETETLIQHLVQRTKVNPLSGKCAMMRDDQMAITMNGDVLSCHDYSNPESYVGHISALDKVDISKHFKPWSQREKCRKCLVLDLCRGACPQMEGLARTLTCRNEFAYAFASFQAVFWLLFGLTLESYQPAKAE